MAPTAPGGSDLIIGDPVSYANVDPDRSDASLMSTINVVPDPMVYQPGDAPPGYAGNWRVQPPGIARTVMGSEFVEFSPTNTYTFDYWVRESNAVASNDIYDGYMYAGFAFFDIDHNYIAPYHVNERDSSRTTLVFDLNPGDTQMVVYSTNAWMDPQSDPNNYHLNSIIIWDWVDSAGKRWNAGTYSRHVILGTLSGPGYTDVDRRTITLRQPYQGARVLAGTAVSNGFSGGSFSYTTGNTKVPYQWTKGQAVLHGSAPPGTAPGGMGWAGTRYFKVLFLLNRTFNGNNSVTASRTDQRLAGLVLNYPEIVCHPTAYFGGAMALWGNNLAGDFIDIKRYDVAHPGGEYIRGGKRLPIRFGTMLVNDAEVPFDTLVRYEVTQFVNGTEVVLSSKPCIVSGDGGASSKYNNCVPVYLTDPMFPSSGRWFGLLRIGDISRPERAQLYDVLGRRPPVAVSQVRSRERTSIILLTKTLQDRTDMDQLLGSGRVLLLKHPDYRYPERFWYIAVAAATEARIAPDHADPVRRWELEIAVVDRPSGVLNYLYDSYRTYEILRTTEPDGVTPIDPYRYGGYNLDGVYTDYPNYFGVLLGSSTWNPGGAGPTPLPMGDAARDRYPTRAENDQDLSYNRGVSVSAGTGKWDEVIRMYPTYEAARTSWSLR